MATRFRGQGYWSIAESKFICNHCKKEFYGNSSWAYSEIKEDLKLYYCTYGCFNKHKLQRSNLQTPVIFKPRAKKG